MKTIDVLIIEDDVKISEVHRMFVEKVEGYRVAGIANSIADAEKMLDILEPDLVLLDLYFPEGSGMELLHRIRGENRDVDVILITAAREMSSLEEAMRGGVYDYQIKPVVLARFEKTLKNYRERVLGIDPDARIEQADVDSFLSARGVLPEETNEDVPKGIDPLTLSKVRDVFVRNAEGLSAEKVGALVGVSRTTARRYLEYLVGLNQLVTDQTYGTVGRPERRYLKP